MMFAKLRSLLKAHRWFRVKEYFGQKLSRRSLRCLFLLCWKIKRSQQNWKKEAESKKGYQKSTNFSTESHYFKIWPLIELYKWNLNKNNYRIAQLYLQSCRIRKFSKRTEMFSMLKVKTWAIKVIFLLHV